MHAHTHTHIGSFVLAVFTTTTTAAAKAFFGPAPVTQIHSEITTRLVASPPLLSSRHATSRVELSSKSVAAVRSAQVSSEREGERRMQFRRLNFELAMLPIVIAHFNSISQKKLVSIFPINR